MESYRSVLAGVERLANGAYTGVVKVSLADATKLRGRPARFDLLVSSPPYGDNTTTVTYGQHSYLPLQWIDLEDIDSGVELDYLKTTHEVDRRSLGGKISTKRLDAVLEVVRPRSDALRKTLELLRDEPVDRRARVAYFYQDLDRALGKAFAALRPNAYMMWVVGNRRVGGVEIPTDKIVTELLARRGAVEVAELQRTIYHKRMPGRNGTTNTMGKERVIILRRPSEAQGSI